MKLPQKYSELSIEERRLVREQYIRLQDRKCWYCQEPLAGEPSIGVQSKKIFWHLFPPSFMKYPVHLQHNHKTDLTEGAVHALCNAVLWQYEGR